MKKLFNRIREDWESIALLVFFVISVLLVSFISPFNSAPDEKAHFANSYYISKYKALPNYDDIYRNLCPLSPDYDRESRGEELLGKTACETIVRKELGCYVYTNQVYLSLGYIIGAFFIWLFALFHLNLYLAARLVALLFGILSFIFLKKLSKLWFKDKNSQLFFLFFIFLIPQFIYIHSYFNPDAYSVLAGVLLLYFSTKAFKGKKWQDFLLTGISGALVLWARYNFFILLLYPLLLFGLKIREGYRKGRLKNISLKVFSAGGISLFLGGLYFIRNKLLFGDVLGMKYVENIVKSVCGRTGLFGSVFQDSAPKNYFELFFSSTWLQEMAKSFFGKFGYMEFNLPAILYGIFYIVIAFLIFLSIFKSADIVKKKNFNFTDFLYVFSLFLLLIAIFLSARNSLIFDYQPQGRYLFNAIPFVSYLIVVLIKGANLRIFRFLLFVFFLLSTLYFIYGIIVPKYLL